MAESSSSCDASRAIRAHGDPARRLDDPAVTVPTDSDAFDVVLVGGGLQNCLIALALLDARPATRLLLLERDDRIGGNHTWCFHEGDVPPAARGFVAPLVEFEWPGYDVLFPGFERRIDIRYAGCSADRLRAVVAERFGASGGRAVLRTRAEVAAVAGDHVVLADGERIAARLVIDSRGPGGPRAGTGYQKFLGQEVVLEDPHRESRPIVMDARVAQDDGFRFVYVLPLGSDRLLVEDTRFADGPELDVDGCRRAIAAYLTERGYRVRELVREETGVLPMPWRDRDPRPERSPLVAGYAGGFLHPATGYSFPIAVRLAACIAATGVAGCFGPELRKLVRRHRRQARYARLLNGLLFLWFRPDRRRHVFERFYRLPEARIRRFYALDMTPVDRLRLLVGRPPRGFSLFARLRRRDRPS